MFWLAVCLCCSFEFWLKTDLLLLSQLCFMDWFMLSDSSLLGMNCTKLDLRKIEVKYFGSPIRPYMHYSIFLRLSMIYSSVWAEQNPWITMKLTSSKSRAAVLFLSTMLTNSSLLMMSLFISSSSLMNFLLLLKKHFHRLIIETLVKHSVNLLILALSIVSTRETSIIGWLDDYYATDEWSEKMYLERIKLCFADRLIGEDLKMLKSYSNVSETVLWCRLP